MTLPQRGNIRFLLDPLDEYDLDCALARGRAVRRVRSALETELTGGFNHDRWRGLIRCVPGHLQVTPTTWQKNEPPLPFGWTRVCVPGIDAHLIGPWWLMVLFERRYWWWLIHREFARLGIRQGKEGDYISSWRWTARVWESERARHYYPRLTALVKWCYDDFNSKVLRWT